MATCAFRRLWSFAKPWWILIRETIRIVGALVRGNTSLAAERARVLGVSMEYDLQLMVAAVQRVLPFWPKPNFDIDRILIVKLDRIGDMVTTTPAFDVLRELFPKARLDIVGHPGPLSLLDGDERIGERIPYQTWLYHDNLPVLPCGPRGWLLVLKLLWRRYPLVVNLRGSFPFLFLALFSRMTATRFIVGEPVIERYLKSLEALFGPLPRPEPRLHVEATGVRQAEELLDNYQSGKGPRVVIHAAASAVTKMWAPERFAEVADQLVDTYGAQVHFLGSQADRTGQAKIDELSTHRHGFHCTLRLPQVVAVIAACDLFIGNDSGLAHIAAAVKTPAVVLWGPANLNLARPKAGPEQCSILYHEVACRNGCPEVRCVNPIHLDCLLRIQAADVLEAAGRHLRRGRPGPSTLPLPVDAVCSGKACN
jgi:heptosyltransferase-3